MGKLICFFIFCFILSGSVSYAQTQITTDSSTISGLDYSSISLTNVKVNSSTANGSHLDVNNAKDTSVVQVTISLNNVEDIDSLQIRYGSDKGDFFDMNLKQVIINSKPYFKWYDFLYPVSNGSVTFTGMSTNDALSEAGLIVLNVKDKSGNFKSILPIK
jgi:hypothetical protein